MMDIWAKLIEVDGYQLLIEKGTARDESDQDMPAIICRSRTESVEMENKALFKTESIRDKAFSEMDDGLGEFAAHFVAEMIRLGKELNTEEEN